MFRLSFAMTLAIAAFSCVHESAAQRVPGYAQRATLSPYVNLFNNNQGGVNNYFTFVRPLQQQARINQQQAMQNRMFERQLMGPTNSLYPQQGAAQFPQGMLRPANVGVGQPSTAATYFNYSHFYNVPPTTRRRQ